MGYMKNQQGFVGIIVGVLIALALLGGAYYFYSNKVVAPTKEQQINNLPNTQPTIPPVVSNYGFSFIVPQGWHIWEGQSAAFELLDSTNFLSVMEEAAATMKAGKTLSRESAQKILDYQKFMNNWEVGSSTVIVFTNANLDYKDRDLAKAGKYASTPIDSTDIINKGATELSISSGEVDLGKAATSSDKREIRNIDINGTPARLAIGKTYKLVDLIMISLPINSNQYINGKKVQSLRFVKYVKKNDTAALQELISFISQLNISKI
jgi:hypothetical protein